MILVDIEIERLDHLISRLKGHCKDCRTPCMKAHPSHTDTCDCCKFNEWMQDSWK
jgi:hypothetical protein